jgi:hypothetical protein
VASLLARKELNVGDVPLPRGQALVMGGDEVYPKATRQAYTNELRQPYAWAAPDPDKKDDEAAQVRIDLADVTSGGAVLPAQAKCRHPLGDRFNGPQWLLPTSRSSRRRMAPEPRSAILLAARLMRIRIS